MKDTNEDRVVSSKKETFEKIVERRRVELDFEKQFEIDRNKLAFKTDSTGEIQASYLLTHSTQKDEKIIIYSFLENDNTPIIININGKKARYHEIDVPKNGEKKIDLTLTGLPPGDHLIYLFGEKYLEKDIEDELEIKQTQEVISHNYFSLEVLNSDVKPSIVDLNYKEVDKVGISKEVGRLTLQLYEDLNLTTEVNSIEKKNYFLAINNPSDYKLESHLKLIADYKAEELNKIIVPENSEVFLPVDLNEITDVESIRFILVGKPTEDINVLLPARIIQKSKRFFA